MVVFNEIHNKHLQTSIGIVSILTENKKIDWHPIWRFMKTKKIQKSKILNFNFKNLGNNILDYPYVEIKWLDIEGDAGWSSTKDLKNQKLPVCVSKGYLLSQKSGVTRIFVDFIKTKDKETFEDVGNTTIIPTSVIQSIRKIKV